MKNIITFIALMVISTICYSQEFPVPQNLTLDHCYNNEGECVGDYEIYDNIFTFSFDAPDTSSIESKLISYNLYEENGDLIANFIDTSIIILNTIDKGFYYVTAVYDNPQGESLPSNLVQSFGSVISVNDFDLSANVLIYPNPMDINYSLNIKSSFEIKRIIVLTFLGKEILQTTNTNIDFSKFNEKLYFIKVITNKGIVIKKIIKT